MEPKGPSSAGNQDLNPLEYSKPECWCESTGHYTNPQGQELELRVRGKNPERVDEYMKAVRIWFEVLPVREDGQAEETPSEEDDKYQRLIEEEFKKLELHPELDLEIELDAIKTPEIELPYELHVVIDPPIAGGATDKYKTKNKTKQLNVTLTATNNGVYGTLDITKQADTYPPNPPNQSAKFSKTVPAEAYLYFSVTGIKANNSYTYSSNTTLVKI